jgi:hypothetical protein
MNQRHSQVGDGRFVRQYSYPETTVVAVDVGGAATVDMVDQTAIVVPEDGETFEFDLPGESVSATVNNGVVVVEVAA